MKWTHWPVERGSCELYQLDIDDMVPIRGVTGELFVVNYENNQWICSPSPGQLGGWKVQCRDPHKKYQWVILGTLPFDMSEEELKATAIAMWRMR